METMELWNQVCKTDPSTTKKFRSAGGFQGTAVCAQTQRKKATEIFGPYGIGWGVKHDSFNVIELGDDPHNWVVTFTGILYYKYKDQEGIITIQSDIPLYIYVKSGDYWRQQSDIYKNLKTDAMTKGLSELGFNSDIFEGKFDDNKYIQDMHKEFSANDAGEKKYDIKDVLRTLANKKHKKIPSNEANIIKEILNKPYSKNNTIQEWIDYLKEL